MDNDGLNRHDKQKAQRLLFAYSIKYANLSLSKIPFLFSLLFLLDVLEKPDEHKQTLL